MARSRMALTLAAVGVAALIGGGATAEAAPMSPSPLALLSQQITVDSAGAEKVHYPYRYCWRWRVRCANRYGWHTPLYRRCLRRHACR